MSFEIPEQAKYRLSGGVVLILIAAFVLPGLMKKSNQRFEEGVSSKMSLPPKPKVPVLKIPSSEQVFQSVKPAKIIDEPKVVYRALDLQLSTAQPLVQAPVTTEIKPKILPVLPPQKMAQKPQHLAATNSVRFSIQLATFLHQENASFLLKRLRDMGYKAQIVKLTTQHGVMYQVVVGQLVTKQNAIDLQKHLSQNLQLQGLIIAKELT